MGSKKHPTAWCMYSHEARIALLAGADGGLWVQVTHPLIMHCYIGAEDDFKMHYMFSVEGAPQLEACIALLAGADGGLWVQVMQSRVCSA